MTDLRQSLLGADFNFLQVVAEKWGLKFDQPDTRHGLDLIVESLLALDGLSRIDKILAEEELQSLAWLQARGGKALWDHFSRRFGGIREMGAGRLEREQPYLDPISPAESLWYRALIARGFLDTDSGPREFVFIPEDLLQNSCPPFQIPMNWNQHLPVFLPEKPVPRNPFIIGRLGPPSWTRSALFWPPSGWGSTEPYN